METKNSIQKTNSPLKVAIVGASGYTGVVLLSLLYRHPNVEIAAITSEQKAGQPIKKFFPSLGGCYSSLKFEAFQPEKIASTCSFIFLALPHKTAMDPVANLLKAGKRMVDLSADYRFNNPAVYEQVYQLPHRHPHLLGDAVYGLPEFHREKIRKAHLIGNPGCYPTGALLGLYPLLNLKHLKPEEIFIDAKSGVSGAGRSPSLASHFVEVNEGLGPYQVGKHRHAPEIEQEITSLAQKKIPMTFVPHLVPMSRGILTTLFVKMNRSISTQDLFAEYREAYSNEPFIWLLPEGEYPNTRHVLGTNGCEIGLAPTSSANCFTIFTAIDNLGKGAAGQAIQNMNLMMNYPETLGLRDPGFFP